MTRLVAAGQQLLSLLPSLCPWATAAIITVRPGRSPVMISKGKVYQSKQLCAWSNLKWACQWAESVIDNLVPRPMCGVAGNMTTILFDQHAWAYLSQSSSFIDFSFILWIHTCIVATCTKFYLTIDVDQSKGSLLNIRSWPDVCIHSWKALVIHPQFHLINTGLVGGMLYIVIL